jgi:hypothetical protein
MWVEHLDYRLGPYVHKLYARDAFGATSSDRPWNLVLSYELEVRRKMVEHMSKGMSIDKALPASYKDALIKERCFTTPLALGATIKRPPTNNREDGKTARWECKGKGKGKGKKGKGSKRQREDGRCPPTTPDGKKICFGFNSKATPCDKAKCPFLHVCGRCFRDHPMWQCPS